MFTVDSEEFFDDLSEVSFVFVTSGCKKWITKTIRDSFEEPCKAVIKESGSEFFGLESDADYIVIKLYPSVDFNQDRMRLSLKNALNEYFKDRWKDKAKIHYSGEMCWSEVSFYFETFKIPTRDISSYIRMGNSAPRSGKEENDFEQSIFI